MPSKESIAAAIALAKEAQTPGVSLELCPLASDQHATEAFSHDGPQVWIAWIESEAKGAGAQCMEKLVAAADHANVVLRCSPDDDGSGKLQGYYQRFGFRADPAGGEVMERAPAARKPDQVQTPSAPRRPRPRP